MDIESLRSTRSESSAVTYLSQRFIINTSNKTSSSKNVCICRDDNINIVYIFRSSAYKVACLNVTYEDWQALAHAALQATNFPLAKKCLIKLENWRYLDLLDAHNHNADQYSSEQNKIIFLARYNAYRGLFAEAGKLYRKARLSQLAADMFTDLQMYDQAKEFATEGRVVGDIGFGESREVASGRMQVDTERTSGEDTNTSIGNIKTMSELYILKGDYDSALELIAKTSIDK